MVTNADVAQAFWKGYKAENTSMTSTGDKLFSFNTVILQRLPDGRVRGNNTQYSHTTTMHQNTANVEAANVLVNPLPFGAQEII